MTHDGRRRGLLAIDTATSQVVVATGSPDGEVDGISTWAAGHRQGETLLAGIGRLLGEQNLRRSRLVGVVVGTGPGAFTGLRVGIATAKGLAHALGIPLVGVSTAEALIDAASAAPAANDDGATERIVLLLPAGPRDRLVVRRGVAPVALAAGIEPELAAGEALVAVDLDERAPADAVARGHLARRGFGAALVRAGALRLAAGGASELATLVPDYVTLPRGARPSQGTVAWSRDHR
ncbi:MAG TPA: tRNA (adenosine(37)-N6)-threonylcarbamoyltransferase complex dimerization subunit type 1 TsaB [Candidatus Limnocylindrales bacterium]|nr:tRNA (adenosine(37)-N6)-threonylcarbamoyltransferase complex dimerization subunit type 1 TsaB [Candidatus Limnocylindrales bacterium]